MDNGGVRQQLSVALRFAENARGRTCCPVCGADQWVALDEHGAQALDRCMRCQVIRHRTRRTEPQTLVVRDSLWQRLLERAEDAAKPLRVVNASWVDAHASWNGCSRRVESIASGNAFAPGAADLCLMPFALEQALDPNQLLRRAHASLKPGGRLVLQAFNPTSLPSLLAGDRWPGLSIPGQVYCFRRHHIELMLQRAGFRLLRVAPVSAKLERADCGQQRGHWFATLWRVLGNWSAALLFEAAVDALKDDPPDQRLGRGDHEREISAVSRL